MSRVRRGTGWWWVLPALALYAGFVLYPLSQTVRYSFYDWDGIGPATWVGLDNYRRCSPMPGCSTRSRTRWC